MRLVYTRWYTEAIAVGDGWVGSEELPQTMKGPQ